MQFTYIVLLIFSVIIIFWVLKLVTKLIFKLFFLALILFGGYFLVQYFQKSNIIDDVTDLYCIDSNNQSNSIKCDCFVEPIVNDLQSRFSELELSKIKSNPMKAANEFRQSYQNMRLDINKCFKKNGESENMLDEIMQDFKKKSINTFLITN